MEWQVDNDSRLNTGNFSVLERNVSEQTTILPAGNKRGSFSAPAERGEEKGDREWNNRNRREKMGENVSFPRRDIFCLFLSVERKILSRVSHGGKV